VDGRLVCTGPQAICLLDTRSGQLSEVWKLSSDTQGVRINDGYCHPNGDFWFGTMDLQESAPLGDFYRLRASGACERVPTAFAVTNGPAFTPDGTVGYFVDTLGRRILQAPLIDGAIAEPWRPFVRIPDSDGYPDGLALDADGGIWCAHWGGNRVTRFDPDGRITDVVHLPVSNATKCAFGGERLDRLYITTARKGLDASALLTQPLAGGLFEVEVGYRGVSPPPFRGEFSAGIPLGTCLFSTLHP
jgi:sugar lactone lactonase YvrE